MIQINLHDYRDELRKIEIQKRVVKCSAIVIAAILFIAMSWFMEQVRLDAIKSETRKLESQVAGLKAQVDKVKAMQASQKRLKDIIVGIERLREQQMPASAIVGDLNLMVPEDLWLASIIQRDREDLNRKKIPTIMFGNPGKKKKKRKRKKKAIAPKEFVEVSGFALTENGVAEYMKRLQKLPYYKTTFLYKSSWMSMGDQAVLKFTIFCYMPEKQKKKSA
jgi:Tfp pilus assembly protein PilN